jgi:hypothetical protein
MNRILGYRSVLFSIALMILITRLIMLFRSPEPNGLDGAFYAMEFRSIMERGYLENRDWSPIFSIGGFISLIFGNALWGVKITSAFLSAGLSLGVFSFLHAMNRQNKTRALFGAVLVGISPSLAYMSVNYLNNSGGLMFALFSCSTGLGLLHRFTWKKLIAFVLLTILSLLSHRVSAVYLFVILGFSALTRVWSVNNRLVRWFLPGGALLFFFLASLTLNPADIQRFSGAFSFSPILPILSVPMRKILPHAVLWEMSLYFCLAYGLLFYGIFKNRRTLKVYLFVPFFFFPFWDLSTLNMGYRLWLSSIPAGIIFLCSAPFFPGERKGYGKLLLCLPVFLLTIPVYQPPKDPPYQKYREVVQSLELDEDSLLIAHLGLNHIYTYEKGFKDALNYLPDFPVPEEKLWRLAYYAPQLTLSRLFPENMARGEIQFLPYDYTLIREDLWQKYLHWEDEEIITSLTNWYNPDKTRPDFIR